MLGQAQFQAILVEAQEVAAGLPDAGLAVLAYSLDLTGCLVQQEAVSQVDHGEQHMRY